MAFEQVGFDADALIASGSALRREFLQNIGVKRLAGAELISSGRVPNYLYYINEIKTVAVYSPVTGLGDVWTGLFGQAVAGTQAVRDTITPLEGQWFYNLDTSVAEQYLGGVWETSASGPAINAPSYVIVNSPRTLVAGRRYMITGDTAVTLPTDENSLDGHVIEVEAAPSSNASLQAAGLDSGMSTAEGIVQVVELEPHAVYRLIYTAGLWIVHTSLVPTALYEFLRQVCEQAALEADQSAQEAESFRDQAEAAAQDAIAAAAGVVSGNAPMGVFDPSTGITPTPPAASSASWISVAVGSVEGLAFNVGDLLVYVYPAGTWHLIRTSQSFQIINGKSGATITLTAQDVLAVATADRVGPTTKVMSTGYRGAPTEGDTATFLTTDNFSPELYLLRGATSVFGRLVIATADADELRTLLELTDAATATIGAGDDELVSGAVLAAALSSLGELADRDVEGTGALITVGYGGLGGLAQEVAWNTSATTDSSRFVASMSNSPIEGVRTTGISVRAGTAAKHSFQLSGRSSRAFFRTTEGTDIGQYQEILGIPGTRFNMAVNQYGLDADGYRALGAYSVTQDVANLPVAEDGTLTVGSVVTPEGGYALTQTYQPYSDINPRQYFRAAKAGTFGAWANALLSANLGTAASADIGEGVGNVMGVGAFDGPTGIEHFWHSGNLDPASFAAATHTHAAADITSGVLDVLRIPNLAIAKVTGLQTALDAKVPNTLTLTAGAGLTGGGTLEAPRTVSLGTPSGVGNGSTNSVTGTTHSHALSLVAGDIPNLDASKITAGTLAVARLAPNDVATAVGSQDWNSPTTMVVLGSNINAPTALAYGGISINSARLQLASRDSNLFYRDHLNGGAWDEVLRASNGVTAGGVQQDITGRKTFKQPIGGTADLWTRANLRVAPTVNDDGNYMSTLTLGNSASPNYGFSLSSYRATVSSGFISLRYHNNTAAGVQVLGITHEGRVVADSFSGAGTELTALNGSAITTGSVAPARCPRGAALHGFTPSTSGPSGGLDGDFWFQYS